jgi:putative redox protein
MARVTAFLERGTRVLISNDRYEWLSDEPLDTGGTAEGPSPYEQLLGSLAACTAITLRLYAKHKGFDLAWVRLAYEHSKAGSDAGVDGPPGRIERITAHVTIGGDFDEAQRLRLTQIAARCPVHRTLSNGVEIVDTVSFADADGAKGEMQNAK